MTRTEQLEDLYLRLRARQRVVCAQYEREVAQDSDLAAESLGRWCRMGAICDALERRIGLAWLEAAA